MADRYESSPDFVLAMSLIAALEGACKISQALDALPYLGMARAELTDCGLRVTTHFEDIQALSFDQSLADLDRLLGDLQRDSADLTATLRVHAARGLLREPIDLRSQDAELPGVRDGSTAVASPHDNQPPGGSS
jgi:hypothetical protein